MTINRMSHISPERAQAGGFVVGEVRSWYNDAMTLGMRDLMMIK